MKKLLTLISLVALFTLTTSLMVNAEEVETNEGLSKLEERQNQRSNTLAQKQADREARTTEIEAKQAQSRERLLNTITTYAPHMLEDFENVQADHDVIHVELSAALAIVRENHKSSTQDAFALVKEDIKAQIDAGELDRAGAKDILSDFRNDIKSQNDLEKEAFKGLVEELKTTYGQSKEARQILFTDLKTAIDAEDDAAIVNALDAIYKSLENHVNFDEAKLDLINTYLLNVL